MRGPRTHRLLVVLLAAAVLAACERRRTVVEEPGDPIVGEGATFPAPLYDVWTNKFFAETGEQVSYSPTGSSQGVEGVLVGRVDFGGSEAPLTAEQLAKAGEVLQIPTTLGAVAVVYNVAGAWNNMKLTPEVLAAIFLCDITNWNDTRISWLNGGTPLPPAPIQIIYRKDGSGTTKVFTDYLSKVSSGWKERVGSGTKVQWPCGSAEEGNAGVTEGVKRTAGSIGYVSLGYARVAPLYIAAIGNKAGQFIEPSLDSVTAA